MLIYLYTYSNPATRADVGFVRLCTWTFQCWRIDVVRWWQNRRVALGAILCVVGISTTPFFFIHRSKMEILLLNVISISRCRLLSLLQFFFTFLYSSSFSQWWMPMREETSAVELPFCCVVAVLVFPSFDNTNFFLLFEISCCSFFFVAWRIMSLPCERETKQKKTVSLNF